MTVYQIDPLRDPRWDCLAESHRMASVFHTRGWLEALHRAYKYQPIVLTTTGAGEPLKNGLVLCKVASWLTGDRLVSLPFSDHCQPLVDDPADLLALLKFLEESVGGKKYKYAELRPLTPFDSGIEAASHAMVDNSFCFHTLDLRPPADALLRNFHKSHIQRKLARAKKEELAIEEGQSEKLLGDFFGAAALLRRFL
jgi:hypothetical protein